MNIVLALNSLREKMEYMHEIPFLTEGGTVKIGEEEYGVHMRGPKRLNKYYEKCMDQYGETKGKEYCARVAFSIYCANVNPSYKGCTKFGKKWGKPYSAPIGESSDENLPHLTVENGKLHYNDDIFVYQYDEGDADTIRWPLQGKKGRKLLAGALYDLYEVGEIS